MLPIWGLTARKKSPHMGGMLKPSKGSQSRLAFKRQCQTGGESKKTTSVSGLAPMRMAAAASGIAARRSGLARFSAPVVVGMVGAAAAS